MTVQTPEEMAGLRRIGRIVALTLQEMQRAVRPGLTTQALDQVGADFFALHGARSAPVLTYRFPGATCISLNDEAAHGIPGPRVIQPGDVVKIDVSAEAGGYFADAALTVLVPPVAPRNQALYDCARAAFAAAAQAARAGAPLNQIGRAAEGVARRQKYSVIAGLPGHGLGRALHEEPSVPMVFVRRAKRLLTDGLVITVEPHVAAGHGALAQGDDGWTLLTRDGSTVAAYEHTLVVTHGEPVVITAV
jgi:methionyl aminopeptidase